MLDFGHLPIGRNADVQLFLAGGNSVLASPAERYWVKPRGYTMLFAMLQGPGGGGGGGFTGAAATQRGGAGGGGSGATIYGICPLLLVPEALIVSVGPRGAGAPPNSASGSTGITSVSVPGWSTALMTATGGSGGNVGSATAGGIGGFAGTATATSQFGIMATINGSSGGAGGASAAGTAGTAGVRNASGSGGAGVTSGNVTASGANGVLPSLLASSPYAAPLGGAGGNPGVNGADGFSLLPSGIYAQVSSSNLLFGVSGAGGGSSGTSGAGGNGGKAGLGCGGGGGGAGVTGGAGGDGGDGFVLFVCF